MRRRRGSTLVEASIILFLFLVLLIGIMDVGQVLFLHHLLTERVRSGARYAVAHTYDQAAIRNMVVYNAFTAPPEGSAGLFGLTTAMVEVNRYDAGAPADRIAVEISTFEIRFLSPWLKGAVMTGPFRAIVPLESAGNAH